MFVAAAARAARRGAARAPARPLTFTCASDTSIHLILFGTQQNCVRNLAPPAATSPRAPCKPDDGLPHTWPASRGASVACNVNQVGAWEQQGAGCKPGKSGGGCLHAAGRLGQRERELGGGGEPGCAAAPRGRSPLLLLGLAARGSFNIQWFPRSLNITPKPPHVHLRPQRATPSPGRLAPLAGDPSSGVKVRTRLGELLWLYCHSCSAPGAHLASAARRQPPPAAAARSTAALLLCSRVPAPQPSITPYSSEAPCTR